MPRHGSHRISSKHGKVQRAFVCILWIYTQLFMYNKTEDPFFEKSRQGSPLRPEVWYIKVCFSACGNAGDRRRII